MSSLGEALKSITTIGNYSIPTFGAIVTSSLALSPAAKESPDGLAIIVHFALYTLLASFVAYWHRLAFLRRSSEQARLSTSWTGLFLSLHFLLIIALSYSLYARSLL